MKTLFFTILLTGLGLQSHSQLLRGEWQGEYVTKKQHYPIFLEFVLNPDSTYSVYSYSKGGLGLTSQGNAIKIKRDSVIVCKVFFKLIASDSMYLEEIEVIQPANYEQNCFQKMNLKIREEADKIRLVGDWKTTSCSHKGSGQITFWKKKEANLK